MKITLIFPILCFLLILPHNVQSWRNFWKGRYSKGNTYLNDNSENPVAAVSEQWFQQNLDHFDPTNTKTWQQRYYSNEKFHKEGGPVFLMIGGEGEATAKWMNEGAWIHYAEQNNAICFQVEHRYYGKSHPTEDLSTSNLLYLSSEQALADLAYFIESINAQYNFGPNTKWIAFGGSYPGSLAAWLREKYPHLVYGAISSSGPLLAKIDFFEYYDVVIDSLRTYSEDCVTAVKNSISQVDILLKHMIGQRSLDEKFQLCDPIEKSIENKLDIANFFESLASNFAGVVQYNKDNSPHATITIDDICIVMTNTTIGAPVSRLAAVNSMLLKTEGEKCLDYKYDKMIESMKNTSWDSNVASGMRQWTYQTCTEFGFYQTSASNITIFGDKFPAEFFVQQCADIYGLGFSSDFLNNSIFRTNTLYGALNIFTTNVLYVHGSIDPWHALGLIKSPNSNLPTIFIQGTAHCANMYEPSDKDFPQLIDARNKISDYILELLK